MEKEWYVVNTYSGHIPSGAGASWRCFEESLRTR